jgi:colanic acid/amylovoran biosynthesis glycosyltransferase
LFAEEDLFLANCAFFAEKARALGCPAGRLHVHGSGLDLARFPFRMPRWSDGGPVRLISAGRLVEKKGFLHAVEAVARLNRDGLRASYDIVGDGPERPRLEARIAELGAGAGIRLLGWRDHAELSNLLTASDLFLAPCQTAADGNADAPVNTLKEAMASGLPVLASRHGGIPELVEHGVSGLLVPERDPDALHAALVRLLALREFWPEMARAGRAAVERLYDAQVLNDELVRLYGDILDRGGRDAA